MVNTIMLVNAARTIAVLSTPDRKSIRCVPNIGRLTSFLGTTKFVHNRRLCSIFTPPSCRKKGR